MLKLVVHKVSLRLWKVKKKYFLPLVLLFLHYY